MGRGWRWMVLGGFVLACSSVTNNPPEPPPPEAEVTPPQVEPREHEPIVGDEADSPASPDED